eukprot:Seg222.2 transcript_id=Seg222.2/GoldUCD/mRNA.D3Y31 product="hypothetical protein" protein_id=Seg222.2/GoldUCD/D3Y31
MNTKRSLIKTIKQRKCAYFGHLIRGDGLQRLLLEGKFNGKRGRGRQRATWFDNIKEWKQMNYAKDTRKAQHRENRASMTANLLRAEGTSQRRISPLFLWQCYICPCACEGCCCKHRNHSSYIAEYSWPMAETAKASFSWTNQTVQRRQKPTSKKRGRPGRKDNKESQDEEIFMQINFSSTKEELFNFRDERYQNRDNRSKKTSSEILILATFIFTVFSECGTKVLICAFHREQAWERWTKLKESRLTHEERKELLRYLRAIADAPANDKEIGNPFRLAVDNLKSSQVWNLKPNVRQYINQWWLSCPERWARTFRENDLERNINTNNGAESLNKLLKYKFLKRSAEKSLTGRPRKFIEHCLPQIKNAEIDFNGNKNLLRIDIKNKLFEVKSSSDQKVYSCDLKLPRCECMDWRWYKLPCKHMFYVFKYVPGIDWNCLPVAYLQQGFLKVDDQLLQRALADSTCLDDATLEDKETDNRGVNDTEVDVNIEHNLDDVNNDKGRNGNAESNVRSINISGGKSRQNSSQRSKSKYSVDFMQVTGPSPQKKRNKCKQKTRKHKTTEK